MEQGKSKRFYLGIGLIVLALLLSRVLSGPFDALEESFTATKYHLRGESKIDSSIVILYLSGDDIASLGGIPLKRSYYALILDVLHDLGAKAVGVDVAFTEPDPEHPEYDEILSAVVRKSGNVVLGGYFRSLNAPDTGSHGASGISAIPSSIAYPPGREEPFPSGRGLELPFPELLKSSASFGHTTMLETSKLPLFVSTSQGRLPSFAFEVLRIGLGASRSDVRIGDGDAEIGAEGRRVRIHYSDDGSITPNFTGGTGSLNLISTVEFLKAYDVRQSGGTTPPVIAQIRGKIVLLGIIAGGRSPFLSTPFSSQFPSIGLHATIIHDALHDSFLRRISETAGYLLAFSLGCACILFMESRRQLAGILAIIASALVLLIASCWTFSSSSIILPVVPSLFAALVVTAGLVLFRHQLVQGQVTSLREEKESIHRLLHDKEKRLKSLEEELGALRQPNGEPRGAALQEEIAAYQSEIARLRTQADDLQPHKESPQSGGEAEDFNGILYRASGPMQEIVAFIKKISNNDANVLVMGESGTGKELVARAIHAHSSRGAGPFVAVNCGALTETLLESELFGHERGAFTGAVRERAGRFELADGGTIFLDEIGETSEAFQVKLLRVLQDGTLDRVGGTETMKVNVRVIAATNRDLRDAVQQKKFREDLYYRLNVFSVNLPPLRDRQADLPLLVGRFIERESPGTKCSTIVMEVFLKYPWKGNVRELQSVLKRAVLLARAEGRDMIRIIDLPEELASSSTAVLDIEKQIIGSVREKGFSRNAISETAEELGGFNRGTVAEYLRGYCFKTFVEKRWDTGDAVVAIAGSSDREVLRRVEKKLLEYLGNAVEAVNPSGSAEQVLAAARPKYKNLPQRYHPYLDELIGAYSRGEWKKDPPTA
ncbi:MAG TPA: sigma 54-interacting transcriptional regulator [Bacteroidota bacterium]|jgi:DNA-binding NtrC family response regulator/CHASE2 domain-containing sensor protein